jgi:hypothetical protein
LSSDKGDGEDDDEANVDNGTSGDGTTGGSGTGTVGIDCITTLAACCSCGDTMISLVYVEDPPDDADDAGRSDDKWPCDDTGDTDSTLASATSARARSPTILLLIDRLSGIHLSLAGVLHDDGVGAMTGSSNPN